MRCHLVALLALAPVLAAERPVLPEGATGLAARYPGDAGLERDPAVIFVERFDEPALEALYRRWEEVKHKPGLSLTAGGVAGAAEDRCLQVTHVGGQGDGSHLYRRLNPQQLRVFARFYVKFAPDCARIHHFGTHLGGFNPTTPWPQGGAGERPDGARRWTTGVEPYGDDWRWDFYTYWQGMRVHGDGRYWGTPFLSGVPRPPVDRGRWICVELMVKMNDPAGESNGEQAFWIDGQLHRVEGQIVSHVGQGFPRGRWTGGWWRPEVAAPTAFEGFRWRTTEALAINYLWTYVYITAAPAGHVSRVWFDNIVLATDYIGPLTPLE